MRHSADNRYDVAFHVFIGYGKLVHRQTGLVMESFIPSQFRSDAVDVYETMDDDTGSQRDDESNLTTFRIRMG